MSLGDFVQGVIFGSTAVASGWLVWWVRRPRHSPTISNVHEAVTEEPGYREPAKVENEEPTRVFCKGCQWLFATNDGYEDVVCLASPSGGVSPITGHQEKFYLARHINAKFDCKLWETGKEVTPHSGLKADDRPPPRPPAKLPDPPPLHMEKK